MQNVIIVGAIIQQKIGQVHPHLNFDLLGKQIKACKEKGIKVLSISQWAGQLMMLKIILSGVLEIKTDLLL